MENTSSIFLELQQFKQLKGENKHAVNVGPNCFYLHTPQSFPPWTNLLPDLTAQGSWKKAVFIDKKQLLCLFDLRKNLKNKSKRIKWVLIKAAFAELFQPALVTVSDMHLACTKLTSTEERKERKKSEKESMEQRVWIHKPFMNIYKTKVI